MARLTRLFSKYNNIVLVILCSCMKKCDTLRSKITFPRFLAHPLKSHCVCLVAESCPTLCDSMDCSLPGSSVPGDSPGNNTGVGCHALLQGIFSTQGSNPGILHCRRILYQLRYQLRFFISPRILEWVAYPFSRGSSQPRNQTVSPALQADSLPAEPPGKPTQQDIPKVMREEYKLVFTYVSSLISHHFPV